MAISRVRYNRLYDLICKSMTIKEELIVFGTCGLRNIVKKHGAEESENLARAYIKEREDKRHG